MRPVTDAPPHPAAVLLLQIIEELCAAIAQATGLNLFARLMMIPVRRQLRGMAAMAAEVIAEAAARTPDAPPTGAALTVAPIATRDPRASQDAHPGAPAQDPIQPTPATAAPIAPPLPAGDADPLNHHAPRPVTQPAAWFADDAPAGPCPASAAAPAPAGADAGRRAAPQAQAIPAGNRAASAIPSAVPSAVPPGARRRRGATLWNISAAGRSRRADIPYRSKLRSRVGVSHALFVTVK